MKTIKAFLKRWWDGIIIAGISGFVLSNYGLLPCLLLFICVVLAYVKGLIEESGNDI